MAAPKCPTPLELNVQQTFIKELVRGLPIGDDQRVLDAVWNSLEYLKTSLDNRRFYQKKQQVKRKILAKIAHEQGWDKEIDDAVAAQHPNIADAVSLDDLEDEDGR